jgi:hypothetical protein
MAKDSKSVLAFYSIDDDSIFDMGIKEIWDDFVVSNTEGVRCINIFHSELSTEELLSLVTSIDISSKLFSDIKYEYEVEEANVMFVKPIKGSPIGGFLLDKFFS